MPAGSAAIPSRTVLGREGELVSGAAFLDDLVNGGEPDALILVGAAGIGKSTLWLAIVEEARRRRLHVLTATPALDEGELAYATLSDLLRDVDAATIGALPEPQRHGLQVARLVEPAAGRRADPRSVAAGLTSVIAALAANSAVLVAVDDVQWIDAPTREALTFCLRRSEHRPVGVLLGLRGDSVTATPLGLERAMAPERLLRLEVPPLSLAALFHLLRERLGQPFGRSALARIADWSGGNPLYALEIGRAILAAGRSPRAGEPPPVASDLAEAVGDRLRGLPLAERRTLVVAATSARPTLEQVRLACRRLRWPMRLPTARDLLAAEDGGLRFAHPLIRAQALRIAADIDIGAAHRALAGLSTDPETRAWHLALATDHPDRDVAKALDDAVQAADARGAPAAAADLAELACRLTADDDPPALLARRSAWGRTLARAGDTIRAREVLEAAIRAGPRGQVRALAMVELAGLEVQGPDRQAALGRCRAALEEVGDAPAPRGTVELACSNLAPDGLEALAHARRALDLLADGPPGLRARAMAAVAVSETYLGRPVRWRLLTDAVALERADPPARVLDWAATQMAWELQMADEFAQAHERCESLRREALDRGDESSLARIDVELAQIDLRTGAWDELPLHAAEAIAVAERNGREHDRIMGQLQLAALAAARGERVADQLLAEVGDYADRVGDPWLAGLVAGNRGSLALAQGDAAAAASAFAEMVLHLGDRVDASLHRYQGDQVESLVHLDRLDEAAALLAQIQDGARPARRRRALALAARGEGLLAAARGDLDAALLACERSVEELTRLGVRFQAARSLLARGTVYRRRREKRLAHDDLSRALAEFEALGAVAWAERARGELGRIGLRPRAPSELTDTERTVARFAAEGKTSREIAAAAFMSPRTVEGVLARIYRKLGVGSRAELGRAMAGEGPPLS